MAMQKELSTPEKINWCPGCGNFGILTAFKDALAELGIDKERTVIVTGIGCHGKMVNHVNVNGFHGLHGRVLPVASAIKLANPELEVIGFSGDADCYDEGWGHFCHAVRRNVDITLIVHDNKVLGLTTGQTTATSEKGFKSKSTPFGSVNPPLNPLAHALVANGTFVARGFAGDTKHLQKLIVEAIRHKGFGYIDVFQPCVSFNYLNTWDFYRERIYKLDETEYDVRDWPKALNKSLEWGDKIPIGIFYKEERPTYRDNLPHVKDVHLTKLPIGNVDISQILSRMM